MLTVARIPNIFSRKRLERDYPYQGKSLEHYIPMGFHRSCGIIEVNGVRIDDPKFIPLDGSEIIFVDLPGGPVLQGGIGIVIAVLIYAATTAFSYFTRPRPPRIRAPKDEDLVRQGFRGVQTIIGSGNEIPFILGEVRAGGHIIESFTDPHFDIKPDSDSNVTVVAETNQFLSQANRLNTRIAWSWGPIESVTDFEIDGNPIANLKGLMYQTVMGERDQPLMQGFDVDQRTERQSSAGLPQKITQSGGAVTVTTTGEVDTVFVKLEFQEGLYWVTTKGNLRQQEVEMKFEYKLTTDGSYTLFKQVTIGAATHTALPIWIRYPQFEPGKYDIRVTRITADNDPPDTSYEDDVWWDVLMEVAGGGVAHPGIAQTGFRQIPQEQSSTPQNYTALIEGANDVRVYSDTSTYTEQYTSNPAWLFLHWLTHPIYGPGKYYTYDDVEDMQEFIDWADYCDENIEDFGVRCKFGFEFKRGIPAPEIRELFERAGDAALIEQAGKWRVVINQDTPPVQFFGEGSYERDSLEHSFIGEDEQISRINGIFQNEDRSYMPDVLPKENPDVDASDSYVDRDVRLWGITRLGQVERTLTRMINENRLVDELIQFNVGFSGKDIRAGDIFKFASYSSRVGVISGRLYRVSLDLTVLYLDKSFTLDSGTSYEITVEHQDASRSISTIGLINVTDDETDFVQTADSSWNAEPLPGDQFSIGEVNQSTGLYRCEQIKWEMESLKKTIIASKYDPAIYDLVLATDTIPTVGTLPDPNKIPGVVTTLTLTQRQPEDSGTDTQDVIDVDWDLPSGDAIIASYEIWFRVSTTSGWIFAGSSTATHFTIYGEIESSLTYEVAVRAVSPTGRKLSLDDATSITIAIT